MTENIIREKALLKLDLASLPRMPPDKYDEIKAALGPGQAVMRHLYDLSEGHIQAASAVDDGPHYLSTIITQGDDPKKTEYFYRARNRALAQALLEAFRKERNEVMQAKGSPPRNVVFESQRCADVSLVARLLIEKEISEVASEVNSYKTSWQIDCLTLDDPYSGLDPDNPSLYLEKEPLAPGHLHHQAEIWDEMMTTSLPTVDHETPVDDFVEQPSDEPAGEVAQEMKAHETDEPGSQDVPHTGKPPAKKKRGRRAKAPSPEDRQMATLYEESGKTQQEVADLCSTALGIPISQKRVSRAVKKVNDWRRLNPDLGLAQIETRKLRLQAVDPYSLEIGPRSDGRAERQRAKRSGDA